MESIRNQSYNGKYKYEWDQSFDDLTLYISVDPKITKKDVSILFKPNNINIKFGNPDLYNFKELKGDLFSTINVSESFWLLQDSELEVHLCKVKQGEVWEYIFKGDQSLSILEKEDEKKKLLLERFQKEHPRFDFSDAQLNGMVPEPRTFMKD